MLSRSARMHLAAMRLIEMQCAALHTVSYIWGGYTLDIYQGRLLREHHDLDYLTMNLDGVKPHLARLFGQRGWLTKELSNGDLAIRSHEVKIQLGNIVEVGHHIRWTHAGPRGYFAFPRHWLRPEPVRFYGADVHVVEPELEYVIKEFRKLLNPDWEAREPDIIEQEQLRAMLQARGIDPESLCAQVVAWTLTPA